MLLEQARWICDVFLARAQHSVLNVGYHLDIETPIHKYLPANWELDGWVESIVSK